jgi:hypothetical protein
VDFDDIVQRGVVALEEAIAASARETVQLEFKGAASDKDGTLFAKDGQLTRGGRGSLGKALSAFSNSAGGLLVIGVDCRKNSDGVDCIQGSDLVPSLETALSVVSGAVGELIQPKHEGVRVHGFASSMDAKAGYLVIDVPRSERRPHMCQADHKYYKRVGTSSYVMEAYDVEDAFRRFSSPALHVETKIQCRSRSGGNVTFEIELWLKNTGNVSAFYPGISWTTRGTVAVTPGQQAQNAQRARDDTTTIAAGTADLVIHPLDRRLIERIAVQFVLLGGNTYQIGGALVSEAELFIDIRAFAKDMRPMEHVEHFGQSRFQSFPV